MSEELCCPGCKRQVPIETKEGYGEVWTYHDSMPPLRAVCNWSQRPILTKIHVTFPPEAKDDGVPVAGEFLWARPTEHPDHFKVMNIPFWASALALHDVVKVSDETAEAPHCVHGEECKFCQAREVDELVTETGHYTAHLMIDNDEQDFDRAELIAALKAVGVAAHEWAYPHVVALDVEPDVRIDTILGAVPAGLPVVCDLADAPEE